MDVAATYVTSARTDFLLAGSGGWISPDTEEGAHRDRVASLLKEGMRGTSCEKHG